MKRTTTLRIVTLCVICAATLMSGCMESNDNAPDGNVLFYIDLILDPHSGPGVMEVSLNEDSTATITTIKGTSDDIIEFGTWQFYRESDDHTMYDIITDDTELRVAFQNDGHAIAYIYENGFTRCGEPFYGVWEQMGEESNTSDESTTDDEPMSSIRSDIIGSITDDESDGLPVLPITATLTETTSRESALVWIVLETDGSMELFGSDEYYDGTWELCSSQSATSRTYDLDTLYQCRLTLRDNGAAKLEILDMYIIFDGTWAEGIDKSRGGGSPASFSAPTPTPTPSGPLVTEMRNFVHARNDDVDVWIYNSKRTDTYLLRQFWDDESTMRCDRGNTYVVVMSHIKNIGNSVLVSGAKDFTAVDSDGNKFYPKNIDDYSIMAHSTELQSGDKIADNVIFEVPEETTGLRIQYYIGDDIGIASWSIQR